MSHSMFSLRLLIVHLCNWVTFVYTEVNLHYYLLTLFNLYFPFKVIVDHVKIKLKYEIPSYIGSFTTVCRSDAWY